MSRLLIAAALSVWSTAALAQSASVSVSLSEWKIEPARDTVAAGPLTFRVKNYGSMAHAFHVKGLGVDKETLPIAAGQSASLTVTLKPGTYDLFCPLSDQSHKKAGMETKLVVTGEATPEPKKPNL